MKFLASFSAAQAGVPVDFSSVLGEIEDPIGLANLWSEVR